MTTRKSNKENEQVVNVNDILLEMQKKINELQEQLNERNKNVEKDEKKNTEFDANRIITVVHLLDNIDGCTTHLPVNPTKSYDLRKFGDKLRLRFPDFEELYYTNKLAFEQNVIGVTSVDEDILEMYNIKPSDKLLTNSPLFSNFPVMQESEMEKFFNSLTQNHKQLIVSKWYAGYDDKDESGNPKNPIYKDKKKIRILNELSGGLMDNLLRQIEFKERAESEEKAKKSTL